MVFIVLARRVLTDAPRQHFACNANRQRVVCDMRSVQSRRRHGKALALAVINSRRGRCDFVQSAGKSVLSYDFRKRVYAVTILLHVFVSRPLAVQESGTARARH